MKLSCLIVSDSLASKSKVKAALDICGQPMAIRAIELAKRHFKDIIVVAKDRREKAFLDSHAPKNVTVVLQRSKSRLPLQAVKEGVKSAKSDFVFLLSADMPLVNSHTIRELLPRACERHDCVSYIWKLRKYEPFCAIYRKSVFYSVRSDARMSAIIGNLRDKVFVPIAIETDEFFKVATKRDAAKACEILKKH